MTWNKADAALSYVDLLVFGRRDITDEKENFHIPIRLESGIIKDYASFPSHSFLNMTLAIFKAFKELTTRLPKEFDFQLTDQNTLDSFVTLDKTDIDGNFKWFVKFHRKSTHTMNTEFCNKIDSKGFQGLIMNERTFFDFIIYELHSYLLNTIAEREVREKIQDFLNASKLNGEYHERIPANLKRAETNIRHILEDVMPLNGYHKFTYPYNGKIDKAFIERLILKNEFKHFNVAGELSLNVDLILCLIIVGLMNHRFSRLDRDTLKYVYWNGER